jgi:hypothetical protein
VVAERLMTPELAPIQAMAPHVDHIHARHWPCPGSPGEPSLCARTPAGLGGPSGLLETVRRSPGPWPIQAKQAKQAKRRGAPQAPHPHAEPGPDGYLPTLPFTNQPVADLLEINTSMARWLRQELG